MMDAQLDMQEVAGRLLRKAGLPALVSIKRLSGGRNNRVFALTLEDGRSVAVKHYHHDPIDTRDRLATEYRFLAYAWRLGVRTIPQPLACEPSLQVALYSFIPGRKLGAKEISQQHISAVLDFVHAINPLPRNPLVLPPASEACFSMDEHLTTIDKRLERLALLDSTVKEAVKAVKFIDKQLHPAWTEIKVKIVGEMKARGIAPNRTMRADETCVSPSDFGFHNILVDKAGSLIFLDFEYAGQDDPAKLVCDFFAQPDIPVPTRYFKAFIDDIAKRISLSDEFRARCDLLLEAYRVKWICILLNDFLPADSARRSFSGLGTRDNRCSRQLAIAMQKIKEIRFH